MCAGSVQRGGGARVRSPHLPGPAPGGGNLRGIPTAQGPHQVRIEGGGNNDDGDAEKSQVIIFFLLDVLLVSPSQVFIHLPMYLFPCRYSKFPVVVPSPTPGYHAHYEGPHLKAVGLNQEACGPNATRGWVEALSLQGGDKDSDGPIMRGYATTLANYLEVWGGGACAA